MLMMVIMVFIVLMVPMLLMVKKVLIIIIVTMVTADGIGDDSDMPLPQRVTSMQQNNKNFTCYQQFLSHKDV